MIHKLDIHGFSTHSGTRISMQSNTLTKIHWYIRQSSQKEFYRLVAKTRTAIMPTMSMNMATVPFDGLKSMQWKRDLGSLQMHTFGLFMVI